MEAARRVLSVPAAVLLPYSTWTAGTAQRRSVAAGSNAVQRWAAACTFLLWFGFPLTMKYILCCAA
jgi:hypothetical protein